MFALGLNFRQYRRAQSSAYDQKQGGVSTAYVQQKARSISSDRVFHVFETLNPHSIDGEDDVLLSYSETPRCTARLYIKDHHSHLVFARLAQSRAFQILAGRVSETDFCFHRADHDLLN